MLMSMSMLVSRKLQPGTLRFQLLRDDTGVQGVGLTKSNDVNFLRPIDNRSSGGGGAFPRPPRHITPLEHCPADALAATQSPQVIPGSEDVAMEIPGPDVVLHEAERALKQATGATHAWVMNDGDVDVASSGLPSLS
jgi:hypothetical protein